MASDWDACDWRYLPDIVLENVYERLGWRDRLNCACVCGNWYDQLFVPRLWRHLNVKETTFTYEQYNFQNQAYRKLSTHRTQCCLIRIGHYLRSLVIRENHCFPNLYSFLSVLNSFLSFFEDYPMPLLEKLQFMFPCETIDLWSQQPLIIGTGGEILEGLQKLLGNLQNMKELTFNNLLLESKDTPGFMDNFLPQNRHTLVYLEILNLTKYRCPLFYAGMFPQLQVLVVSPAQLSDTVVVMVAERTQCRLITIVHDRYSVLEGVEPVTSHAWWEVKQAAPALCVRLEVRGRTDKEVVIQPAAPVSGVMYDSCQSQVKPHMVLQLAEEYKHSLQVYGHKSLHRKRSPRSFYDRADTTLVLLIRECPNISTLVIKERVSTCTLLVIAKEAKKLTRFHVRKNAVILKYDWPKATEWTEEYSAWLKKASRCYDETQMEIGKILRQANWHLLSDKEFINL